MYRDPDLYGKCTLAETYFAGLARENGCRHRCIKPGGHWLGRRCEYWKPLEEK